MTRPQVMRVALAAAAAAVAFLAVRMLAPDTLEQRPVPPAILGSWVTDDPRYAGRAFVIGPDTIELHVGEGEPLRHEILGVHEQRAPGHVAYDITYATADGDAVLGLLSYGDGVIRLERPAGPRWVRGEPRR